MGENFAEVMITIKGEDRTFKQSFPIYGDFIWSQDEPKIKACIAEALENAKVEPVAIKIRSTLEVC